MSDCPVCPDTPGHGWKKQGVTHCHTCHATWNLATKTAHCSRCHATFSTPSNFDRHIAGTKADPGHHCRIPQMVGLLSTTNPYGVPIWRQRGDERTWGTGDSAA